jgi:hypothetical protein
VGFVVDKVVMGQVFSEYFGFPCQFSFHRLFHTHHHQPSGAGTTGRIVAHIPSDSPHSQEIILYIIMTNYLLKTVTDLDLRRLPSGGIY